MRESHQVPDLRAELTFPGLMTFLRIASRPVEDDGNA